MKRIRARSNATVIALALGALLALAAAPPAQPASASVPSPHQAAVVVDLGDGQVKIGCVSFSEDHISGLEALDRASMAPVAQTFGGQGGAVCALCGKGCTAGSTCLTCKAPNYWTYYHDGTYSSIGAGQSQVRDGDIEGWKWGKGEQPVNVPFDQVCLPSGPKPTQSPTTRPIATVGPTTTPSAPVPGGGSGGSTVPPAVSTPGQSGAGVTAPTAATTAPVTSAPGSTTASAPTSTASPAPGVGSKDTTVPADQQPAAQRGGTAIGPKHVVIERAGARTISPSRGSPGSGSGSQGAAWSIAGFGAAIGVVAGLIVILRRRRAGAG